MSLHARDPDDPFSSPFFDDARRKQNEMRQRFNDKESEMRQRFDERQNSPPFSSKFFEDANEPERYRDPFSSPFFDKCKNMPRGFCSSFHSTIGFNNLWKLYIGLIFICLILSAIYIIYIKTKHPDRFGMVPFHIGIFLVNATLWFSIPTLIMNAICWVNAFCSYWMIFIILAIISFILMIIDLQLSKEAKLFKTIKEAEDTTKFFERMKEAKPILTVYVTCFHHETRRRRRNSDSMLSSTRSVKVTSFKDSRAFPIDSYTDETQIPSTKDSAVTIFKVGFMITPGDPHSEQAFLEFKNRFINANSYRDQGMDHNVKESLYGFVDDDILTINGTTPWWAEAKWFYILSFLNASILLRILLRTRCTEKSICAVKKYYVNPGIPRSYDFDVGVVGQPTVVNNYIMAPGTGFPQPQGYPASGFPQPQGYPVTQTGFSKPQGYPAPTPGGYIPTPGQFGQPATVTQPYPPPTYPGAAEMQPLAPQGHPTTPPPAYNPNF